MANFVSYSDAQVLMTKIGQKFSALTGAYIPKGNSAFASLPATPTSSMVGYVYNITDDFTTDARFVEGAGKEYPAGSNVVVVDNSTFSAVTPLGTEDPSDEGWYELDAVSGKYVLTADTTVDSGKTYYAKTVLVQYDVLAGFIDISGITDTLDDLADNFAAEFDSTATYAAGDIVVNDYKLYQFNTAHAAGAWDSTEVDRIDVEDLIAAIKSELATVKNAIETSIADIFDSTNAYNVGDIVYHDDALYKFKLAHTAGDPWSASEVDATQVTDLMSEMEPDSLTPQQIADLEGLLD